MRSYLKRLETIDDAGSLLEPVEQRAILLTGQSSFRAAALSGEQIAFLERLAPMGFEVVRSGFPYHREFDGGRYDDANLIAASYRNALQVLGSVFSARYRRVLARVLQRVLDSTRRRLTVVTGSCGLQLLNAVWNRLRVNEGLQVEVVALGPACFAAPRMPRITVVQGRRDCWSRLLYWGRVDRRCHCGHLEYWQSEEVRSLAAGAV